MSKMKDLTWDVESLFIDGMSPRQIAAELECPLGVVVGILEGFGVDTADVAEKPQTEQDYYGA